MAKTNRPLTASIGCRQSKKGGLWPTLTLAYPSWKARKMRLRHDSAAARKGLLTQLLHKPNDRFDPPIEIRNVELLIRGVQVIVRQSEAHHHARQVEVL